MLLRARQVMLKWNRTLWSFPQVLFLPSLWKNYSQRISLIREVEKMQKQRKTVQQD